jgi:hypothetical protein
MDEPSEMDRNKENRQTVFNMRTKGIARERVKERNAKKGKWPETYVDVYEK